MVRVLVDVDEEALSEATDLLGTRTKKDTINIALRETVLRLRRAQALAQLCEMGESGAFDALLDKSAHRA